MDIYASTGSLDMNSRDDLLMWEALDRRTGERERSVRTVYAKSSLYYPLRVVHQ